MFIRKAERKKAKLRLGIVGASGSGKTWSALEIATGMGGKIGMIDTEAGRGELYANDFEYDLIRLDAPYSPERYIQAIKQFEEAGYDTLIIDSLSHAWVGEGGVLSIVDRAGSKSFTEGWRVATPKQNALIDAIITSKMHIIVAMRVKTEYVTEKDQNGKMVPRKIGLAPVQRDGLEYEFTLFMDMNQEHYAHITKDNTKLYDGQYIKPSKEMGARLMQWLNAGTDVRDDFVKSIVPLILTEIKNCASLGELKDVYSRHYARYESQFKNEFAVIMTEKDKRKEEIMSNAMDDMGTPSDVQGAA
jgi:hypothetical protein